MRYVLVLVAFTCSPLPKLSRLTVCRVPVVLTHPGGTPQWEAGYNLWRCHALCLGPSRACYHRHLLGGDTVWVLCLLHDLPQYVVEVLQQ